MPNQDTFTRLSPRKSGRKPKVSFKVQDTQHKGNKSNSGESKANKDTATKAANNLPSAIKVKGNYKKCPCNLAYSSDLIQCCECLRWWHKDCTGISKSALVEISKDSETPFVCVICLVNNITKVKKLEDITKAITKIISENEDINKSTEEPDRPNNTRKAKQNKGDSKPAEVDNFVILDKVQNPRLFTNRHSILSEVKRVKPGLGIKHAHHIAGGAICLELISEKDKKSALKDWPAGSFGTENIQQHEPLSKTGSETVFVKFVPTLITEKEIKENLPEGAEVTRLNIPGTQKKSNTVKITVRTVKEAEELIKKGIQIKQAVYTCKPKQAIKVFRCFNCQKLGHIAKICWRNRVCGNCAEENCSENSCQKEPKCINCNCKGHKARDYNCPSFLTLKKKLTDRKVHYGKDSAVEL